MDVQISLVSTVTEGLLNGLNRILPQLLSTPPTLTSDDIQAVIDTPGVYLFAASLADGDAVGTAQLAVYPRLYGAIGWIDGVVVDDAQRGKGIATHLMNAILDKARELKIDEVNLTSNAKREAANHLYQKLGFEYYETNYYRLKIT